MRTGLCPRLCVLVLLVLAGGGLRAWAEGAPAGAADSYRIAIGDTLSIAVTGEDVFTRDCQVNGSGTISYPKLGDLPVTGLTCEELRLRLDRDLRTYLRHPQVMVTVRQYGQTGMSVFVMGEVQKPGPYPLANGVGFLQALAAAGGLTDTASGQIVLLKGRTGQSVSFALADLGKADSAAPGLDPGDVMLVQRKEEARYAVLGEVPKPGMFDLPARGEVRVLDAIQAAGVLPSASPAGDSAGSKPKDIINDPTRAADLEHARLTRGGKDLGLDLVALLQGDTAQNLALQAGDVLTVPRRAMLHVYATGEVRSPGLQALPQPATVLDLLNVAGGLTTSAKPSSATLVRMVNGKTESTPVNIGDLVGKGEMKHNRALQEGDVLYVPPKSGPSQWPSVVSALSLLMRVPW